MLSSLSTPLSATVDRPHSLVTALPPAASGVMFPELAASVLESRIDDIDELKKQYSNLIIQIDRLRPSLARISPTARIGDSTWSITEVFGHLIDTDRDIWWPRIDQILVEDRPHFFDIDPNALVGRHNWDALPLEDVLAQLMRVRWNNSMRLNTLPCAAFDRSGVHPQHGEVTLAQILAILVAHDAHYLALVRSFIDSPVEL
jgi:hypothetical protein